MSTIQQFKSETEGVRNVATQPRLLAIPPNFFAITMGLAGLAGVWRLAGDLYHLPASIGDALYVVTAGGFFVLFFAVSMERRFYLTAVVGVSAHTLFCPPFSSR